MSWDTEHERRLFIKDFYFFIYGQVDPHGAYIIHVLKLVMYTEYLLASSIAWRFRFFTILAALHTV